MAPSMREIKYAEKQEERRRRMQSEVAMGGNMGGALGRGNDPAAELPSNKVFAHHLGLH